MDDKEYEAKIAKAFNAGLQMQRHDPKLLDQVLKSGDQQSDILKAMAAGKQHQEREKVIAQQERIKQKDRGKKR
jgi:hypothetical protein